MPSSSLIITCRWGLTHAAAKKKLTVQKVLDFSCTLRSIKEDWHWSLASVVQTLTINNIWQKSTYYKKPNHPDNVHLKFAETKLLHSFRQRVCHLSRICPNNIKGSVKMATIEKWKGKRYLKSWFLARKENKRNMREIDSNHDVNFSTLSKWFWTWKWLVTLKGIPQWLTAWPCNTT